jgi:hypothetical protein
MIRDDVNALASGGYDNFGDCTQVPRRNNNAAIAVETMYHSAIANSSRAEAERSERFECKCISELSPRRGRSMD